MFTEDHGIIITEYLEVGNKVKKDLLSRNLPTEEYDTLLSSYLAYVHARLPNEFWGDYKLNIKRNTSKEIDKYVKNAITIKNNGIGLTLIGNQLGIKTEICYSIIKRLVDEGFTCFTIYFDELVYMIKESRDNKLIKYELNGRLQSDFFLVLDIPDSIDVSSIIQDVVALLLLRKSNQLPILFTVNTNYTSLNDIPITSFLGRLILPFTRVNKFMVIEDTSDLDNLMNSKWEGLSAKSRGI